MSYSFLKTPVKYLKHVGPKRAELLNKELNIFNFYDLITYYPFRYIDRSEFHKIKEINANSSYVQIRGKIKDLYQTGERKSARLTANLEDETGKIELVWFRGIKWIKDKINPDVEYIVFGKINIFNRRYNIPHPEIDIASEQDAGINSNLQAFYNSSEKLKSKGLNSKGISKLMRTLILSAQDNIYETLSNEIIKTLNLISIEQAIVNIHFPKDNYMLEKSILRLKFEELFFLQLKILRRKNIRIKKIQGHKFPVVGNYFNQFYKKNIPFKLTNAQKKVIREIRIDVDSGRQMNRLLQGDVGSGKTLVALMSMLMALDNNYQTCLMAPTEVLANQHFQTITQMLYGLDIKINLFTGSTKTSQRKNIYENLINGNLQILIGTHALIEDKVKFKNLGLVVIDEQHKFGVAQRAKLWTKNVIYPHILVMTATPIPRTLAMTLYGDLDISVIDELPPGRKFVKTYHLFENKRFRVFGFMKEQIKQGRQIYVVYPLIEESEKIDLKNLKDGYEDIVREFPPLKHNVGMLHGKMKQGDKDFEIQRFIKGETQILVSTTVIEVGIDIHNASVMIIENAERFGLSQLHQLRGRVGRGADQSHCILMTDYKLTSDARERMNTMVRTSDGFEIAETDLKLRGPGEMEGTKQSGIFNLKLANLAQDEKILKTARNTAKKLLDDDPELQKKDNIPIADNFKFLFKNKTNWGLIS